MNDIQKLIERLQDPEQYTDAVDEAIKKLTDMEKAITDAKLAFATIEGHVKGGDDSVALWIYQLASSWTQKWNSRILGKEPTLVVYDEIAEPQNE